MSWLTSLISGKCPHCQKASIFKTILRMHETCGHCGIQFERESGFFSMAIFVAYVMATFIGGGILLAVYLSGLSLIWYYIAPIVVIVILFPILFRYGRIIWLYLDEWMDPRPTS